MENNVLDILENASDRLLSKKILDAYKEVERNYFLKIWKTAELDAGHFVESIRRFIELKLFGHYTPIGSNLSKFNQVTLQSYENSSGDVSYRILIPRVLFSVYTIRNKRGVGHIGNVMPNHQDATFILSSCSWCLAELIRNESNESPDSTIKIVEKIIKRQPEGLWEEGSIKRILAENLTLKESILFLLFDSSPQLDQTLQEIIEYKNSAYFHKILKELHYSRFIEYKNSECVLSPKGRIEAEKIILKQNTV